MDDMSANVLSIPFPLLTYFVGTKPLAEAIPAAEPMPDGDALNRRCDVFLFKALGLVERKDDFVYYLDKQTSVPLKVVCYTSSERRRSDRPLWAWEATKLDEVSGHHVAVESIWKRFVTKDVEPGDTPKIDYTQTIHVNRCTFDQEITSSEFWPAYTPGVHVVDTITGKSFRVKGESPVAVSGDPIRVKESGNVPWGVIGACLFVACLLLGLLIHRGRRLRHE